MSQKLESIPKPPKKLTKSGKRMYRTIAQSLLDREALFDKHPELICFFVDNLNFISEWRRKHKNTKIPHLIGTYNKDLDDVKAECLGVANTAFGLDEDELAKLGIRFPKKL